MLHLLFEDAIFAYGSNEWGAIEWKREIQQEYGIEVQSEVNHRDFLFFLRNFLYEADRMGLNDRGRKRFFPVSIIIRVHPGAVIKFKPNVHFMLGENEIIAEHRSALATVSFIIRHFPLEGTEEARQLELRSGAINQAIRDKMRELERMGIDINYSCTFFTGCQKYSLVSERPHNPNRRTLDNSAIIYHEQEKLLQGLVNLVNDVEGGYESRREIDIIPHICFAVPYYFGCRPWNRRFTKQDEHETEELIREYIDQINIE